MSVDVVQHDSTGKRATVAVYWGTVVYSAIIKSSSAMAERPRDACFTLIHKIVKIAFLSYPMGDFISKISKQLEK